MQFDFRFRLRSVTMSTAIHQVTNSHKPAMSIADDLVEKEYKNLKAQNNTEVEKKFRWLNITVVNTSVSSSKYFLEMHSQNLKSGQIWNTPNENIKPGRACNFYTCTSSFMAGCTGVITWQVRHKDGRPGGFVVFSFSNPAVGNIKAAVSHIYKYKIDDEFKDEQYDQMEGVDCTKHDRVAVYQTKEKHLVVVFKDDDQRW